MANNWEITPSEGVTNNGNGEFTLPKNTGTTDIKYTVTVNDENGCSATTSVTVPSGSECQNTNTTRYFTASAYPCGFPDGTVFSFDFDDCGVKSYTYHGNYTFGCSIELENAGDCDIDSLMGVYVSFPNGESGMVDSIPESFGETIRISGTHSNTDVAISSVVKTREVKVGDDTEIYGCFTISTSFLPNVYTFYGDVYVEKRFPAECGVENTGNYYSVSSSGNYGAVFKTNEFLICTLPTYCDNTFGNHYTVEFIVSNCVKNISYSVDTYYDNCQTINLTNNC